MPGCSCCRKKLWLSKKEWLALFQLLIPVVAILNYMAHGFFPVALYDRAVFLHRLMSITLAFVALFYSLGTWFWYSNMPNTRMFIRIHCILVYAGVLMVLYYTQALIDKKYIDGDYWDYEDVFGDDKSQFKMGKIYVLIITAMSSGVMLMQLYYILRHLIHACKKKWKKTRRE